MNKTLFKQKEFILLILAGVLFLVVFVMAFFVTRSTPQPTPSPIPTPTPVVQPTTIYNPNENVTQINPEIQISPNTPFIPSGKPLTFSVSFPTQIDPTIVTVTLIKQTVNKPLPVSFSLQSEGEEMLVIMKEAVLKDAEYTIFVRERKSNNLLLSAHYKGE